MIIKRFHFPFFIFLLLSCACNRNYKVTQPIVSNGYQDYIDRADKVLEHQKYDSAFYYLDKAKTIAPDNNAKIFVLLRMAGLQQLVCDFSGSEASATEAYKIVEGTNYLPYIYNALGIAYEEQANFDEALKYYNKCYRAFSKEIDKCVVTNNIAVIYLEKGDYTKSVAVLNTCINNNVLKSDKKNYAKALDNLGFALFKSNNPKAIDYLEESKKLRELLNDDSEKIASYIHLSEYYQSNNQDLAVQYAQKAYQAATNINSPDDRIEALKFWITNADSGQSKKLALSQISISDSINKVRKSARNQFAKIRYDSTKAIQEKKLSDKQKQNAFKVFVLITLFLLCLIVYVRYRNRRKLKASVYETETRISKKIHDELANDVYQAIAFTETQNLGNLENRDLLLDNLANIYAKARDISQTNSEIHTDEKYGAFLLDLINSFSGNEANIITRGYDKIDWDKISKHSKNALYRVIQELLVNMKKHSEADLVLLNFETTPKGLKITYSDNGKGLAEGTFLKKGLHYAENRIHAVNGTFTFEKETTKGVRIIIQIPK